jgi:hypothetical protein
VRGGEVIIASGGDRSEMEPRAACDVDCLCCFTVVPLRFFDDLDHSKRKKMRRTGVMKWVAVLGVRFFNGEIEVSRRGWVSLSIVQ